MRGKRKGKSICAGCGECCYNVPLPAAFVEANGSKMVTEPESWTWLSEDTVLCDTPDGRCPFLTGKRKCSVYEKRPSICRMFGERTDDPLLWCRIKQGEMPEEMKRIGDFKAVLARRMLADAEIISVGDGAEDALRLHS